MNKTKSIKVAVSQINTDSPNQSEITITGAPLDFCNRLEAGDEVWLRMDKKAVMCPRCKQEVELVPVFGGSRLVRCDNVDCGKVFQFK